MINPKKLRKSFKYAFQGLKVAFKEEQSFRVQIAVAIIVVFFMFVLPMHSIARAVLILAIAFVLGLELLNSQIERVLDVIQPNHNPKVKAIKDLSAAAVLIAVVGAVLVGFFLFFSCLV